MPPESRLCQVAFFDVDACGLRRRQCKRSDAASASAAAAVAVSPKEAVAGVRAFAAAHGGDWLAAFEAHIAAMLGGHADQALNLFHSTPVMYRQQQHMTGLSVNFL